MARGDQAILAGGRALSYVNQKDAYIGSLFERIIQAVNNVAKAAAVSPVGRVPAPHPVDAVNVQGTFDQTNNIITTPSEHLHFTISHNQALQKGVRYFSEIDTDPNFPQPHVIDHGTSRSGFVNLPAKKQDGTTQTYYLRSYAQYPGSDPSKPTVVGGAAGATQIRLTGTSQTDLLPSTGSGTAHISGQQGGKGLGTLLERPAPGPKRSVQL